MKRLLIAAILVLFPSIAFSQGFPVRDIVINGQGNPVAGANVELCAPVATTGAQVVSNIAVFTLASNPITDGFVSGTTLTVSGFTAGDTYFNGTYTITSVTSTTIAVPLTHANASAGTNGAALQEGNASTGCAGLLPIYSDQGETLPITQPTQSDGLGNFAFYATPIATAWTQVYGSSIATQFYPVAVPCIPNTSCGTAGVSSVNIAGDGTLLNTSAGGCPITSTGTCTLSLHTQSPWTLFGNNSASTTVPTFFTMNPLTFPGGMLLNNSSLQSTGNVLNIDTTTYSSNVSSNNGLRFVTTNSFDNMIAFHSTSGGGADAVIGFDGAADAINVNIGNGNQVVTMTTTDADFVSSGSTGLFQVYAGSGGGHLQYDKALGLLNIPYAQLTKGTLAAAGTCNSAAEGKIASITDSDTVTWGASITGGSTNHVLAYCDNSNWTVMGK